MHLIMISFLKVQSWKKLVEIIFTQCIWTNFASRLRRKNNINHKNILSHYKCFQVFHRESDLDKHSLTNLSKSVLKIICVQKIIVFYTKAMKTKKLFNNITFKYTCRPSWNNLTKRKLYTVTCYVPLKVLLNYLRSKWFILLGLCVDTNVPST